MYIKVQQAPAPLGFGFIRGAVEQLGLLDYSSVCEKYLQTFLPFLKVPYKKRSLTDGGDAQEQLRYYLPEHLRAHMQILAQFIIKKYSALVIEIFTNSQEKISISDHIFIEEFSKIKGIELRFARENIYRDENYILPEERKIITLYQRNAKNLKDEDIQFLKECILKLMKVGDGLTAFKIFKFIGIGGYSLAHYYNIGGTCLRIMGEMERAALYYQKSIEAQRCSDNDIYSVADSYYGLSMIFLRHYERDFIDIEEGKKLLHLGYQILKEIHIPCNRLTFARVFNRNGYALVLFRQGNIETAITLLKECMLKLDTLSQPIAIMHKSVILYNLAQCYVALDRFDDARDTFMACLDLDPYYPEYHLEFAKVLLGNKDYEKARKQIETAQSLDKYRTETFSLWGRYYDAIGKKNCAKDSYFKAHQLDHCDEEKLYDWLYCLSENGAYDTLLRELNTRNFRTSSWNLRINFCILEAEAHFNLGRKYEALAVLEEAKVQDPYRQGILDNIDVIKKHLEACS